MTALASIKMTFDNFEVTGEVTQLDGAWHRVTVQLKEEGALRETYADDVAGLYSARKKMMAFVQEMHAMA